MLLPGLLNSNKLFLHFANLNKEKDQKFESLKTEVLSRSTSALLHLMNINQFNAECVKEFGLFENQLNVKDDRIVFTSISLGFLLNEISPLLSTLRMLQNLILKVVSSIEKQSLPSSISDYFKKPNKYPISKDAKELIEKYWKRTGENVKLYRDVDQHFNSLTENYFMAIFPNKHILILFPDNPEEKSMNKFRYEKNINGTIFLNEAFKELHTIFESLAVTYGAKPGSHQLSICMKQLGDLTPARDRALAFNFEKNISQADGKTNLNISGWGIDQLPDLRLSIRQYFLDESGLEKAMKTYSVQLYDNKA